MILKRTSKGVKSMKNNNSKLLFKWFSILIAYLMIITVFSTSITVIAPQDGQIIQLFDDQLDHRFDHQHFWLQKYTRFQTPHDLASQSSVSKAQVYKGVVMNPGH